MLLRVNHYCGTLFARSVGKNRKILGNQRILKRFFGEDGLALNAVQKWTNGEMVAEIENAEIFSKRSPDGIK
jgi:hypothetical protein